jgi:glycosyltransferase involved in cell wall biosynthesis
MIVERGRTYRQLAALEQLATARAAVAMDVCLVTSEILGPASAGGIGTASVALARQLAAEGHRVTLLYTQVWDGQPYAGSATWSHLVEQYQKQGIALAYIPHAGAYADWRAKAWLVMQFLKNHPFDLVYLNEHHGSGYYALSAKRAGIAPFVGQTYCVVVHGSLAWVLQHNDQYMKRPSDLIMIGMERRSVEWADFVLSPSHYLLEEYARYGWRIPENAFVHPYPLIRKAIPASDQPVEVDELVFLGRLETRKGLWLFCEAIERIAESLRGRTVTFMGRMAETAGVSVGGLLVARAARWPFATRFVSWFSTQEALEYLQRPGKLAVMPSIADNSPCVVYECIEKGIPFIATSGSGAQELIAPSHWPDVLVPPIAAALAEKLDGALSQGVRLAPLSFKPEQSLRTWKSWHGWLSQRPRSAVAELAPDPVTAAAPKHADERVLLNVVIDTGDCDLATLLENLRTQAGFLGRTAGHLVLTSRGREFQQGLASLLQEVLAASGSSALVLGVEDAIQAHEIILDADLAFFSGAECHVDLAFYLRAAGLLTSKGASAVSCCVAQATDGGRALEIPATELPCGDLPGAAAVQAPLASSVWAMSLPALRRQFETLALHDETHAQWLPSVTLGQRLIQRCVLDQQTYLLLPTVDARRLGPAPHDPVHWYRDLVAIARDLGFRALAYPDAAPWFAMSSFGDLAVLDGAGPKLDPRLTGDVPGTSHKSDPDAPLPVRLRELALRTARPTLATQLAISNGAFDSFVYELVPSRPKYERRRSAFDLVGLVPRPRAAGGPKVQKGRDERARPALPAAADAKPRSVPGLGDDAPPAEARGATAAVSGLVRGQRVDEGPAASLLVGSALSVVRTDDALICRNRGAAPGRLTFIDVPLERHERLIVSAAAVGRTSVAWDITVVDQVLGETVVRRSCNTGTDKNRAVTIPLPKMLGVLMIVVEIKSGGKAALELRSLELF